MTDNITNQQGPVQEAVQAPVAEEPVKKKRGRKPNPNKKKMYFSDIEEEAFRQYCKSNSQTEKDRLFRNILYPAFTKMVESVIRRYTLFKPGEEFDDTFNDTMSFLVSKMDHFNPDKNKKAFSYCGTICKNYLVHERKKAQQRIAKTISYDTVYNELNPDMRQTKMNVFLDPTFSQMMMYRMAEEIDDMVANREKYGLTDCDIKVGLALTEILRNWDNIFETLESKKYNKSSVDSFIRESTLLSPKQIRESKKKYTELYEVLKDQILNKK